LEAKPFSAARTRLTQIVINDLDPFRRPSQLSRPFHKVALPPLAFLVMDHLV
jgi:hypothetical protein